MIVKPSEIIDIENEFTPLVDESREIYVQACGWQKCDDGVWRCISMLKQQLDKSCCNNKSLVCSNYSETGCEDESEKPLFCKSFLCQNAEKNLKQNNPEAYIKLKELDKRIGRVNKHLLHENFFYELERTGTRNPNYI
ncbi:MAG: hypothetical protein FWC00_02945 [Firmicutes bacterium]|nr:hypothetical protein [Bacillota bacterium]